MKYVVILADGMADYAIAELGNKTPLAYAHTPNMDRLAPHSELGMVKTIPAGMPPGSDVANLSVLGYDPLVYYTGRSPLEALSIGVELQPDDVAFRCNLVTLSDDPVYENKTMIDYSSDEITSSESHILVSEIARYYAGAAYRFYPGISYRHLMIWPGGPLDTILTPPHDIADKKIKDFLPRGKGADLLLEFMVTSNQLLTDHPVNKSRVSRGLRPANSLWFWGQGKKPDLPQFSQLYRLKASVISAVDLTKGLGICADMKVVDVPGATGNIHTNFTGKARAALNELASGQDFVYVHIEAPDEAGHRGELQTKIKAIEEIDSKIVGEIITCLEEYQDYRILILPDHPTPIKLRTHVSDPVPYMIYQKGLSRNTHNVYNEETAKAAGIFIEQGHKLMPRFVNIRT